MRKQHIILAENYAQAYNHCKLDVDPPLNPNDPAVVILTNLRNLQRMRGRHFEESEIHVVGNGPAFVWERELVPYFPSGWPNMVYCK